MKQKTKNLIYALAVGAMALGTKYASSQMQRPSSNYIDETTSWQTVKDTPSYRIQAADLDGDNKYDVRAKSIKGANGSVLDTEFVFENGHGLGLDGRFY